MHVDKCYIRVREVEKKQRDNGSVQYMHKVTIEADVPGRSGFNSTLFMDESYPVGTRFEGTDLFVNQRRVKVGDDTRFYTQIDMIPASGLYIIDGALVRESEERSV